MNLNFVRVTGVNRRPKNLYCMNQQTYGAINNIWNAIKSLNGLMTKTLHSPKPSKNIGVH